MRDSPAHVGITARDTTTAEREGTQQLSIRTASDRALLGVIINPIAGLGGLVGLHGTDGTRWRTAVERGAQPTSNARATRALSRFASSAPVAVMAAPGRMGADSARRSGLTVTETSHRLSEVTTAEDTMVAAEEMLARDVTLLLFAGGDGTARDIVSVVGEAIPIIGVPCGVKMHSGVFGTSPEAAGETAAAFIAAGGHGDVQLVDVLDVAVADAIEPSPFAAARVPIHANMVQHAKASPTRYEDSAIDALCVEIARDMTPDRTYVLGPGTTTGRILGALGVEGTLNGFDVIRNGALIAGDADETKLVSILERSRDATVILGVVGGQGFLLGRGNQQLSARALEIVGEENVMIIASAQKLLALEPPVLLVDMGTDEPLSALAGYRRVRTGPRTDMVLKVLG